MWSGATLVPQWSAVRSLIQNVLLRKKQPDVMLWWPIIASSRLFRPVIPCHERVQRRYREEGRIFLFFFDTVKSKVRLYCWLLNSFYKRGKEGERETAAVVERAKE